MSAIKASVSRTTKASPLGSQATTLESSFWSMSINLRGKGLEVVVVGVEVELGVPGALAEERAGETDAPRCAATRDEVRELLRAPSEDVAGEAALLVLLEPLDVAVVGELGLLESG